MRTDQLTQLVDEFESLDGREKRRRVQDALAFDEYTPAYPRDLSLTTDYHNPGLTAYQAHLEWGDGGWEPIDNTDVLTTYPEYIPTDHAIDRLCACDQLLEIGAGIGYWTYVVEENGGACRATDAYPPTVTAESFPAAEIRTHRDVELVEMVWTDVQEARHEVIREYPTHDVLLCHPPTDDWVEDVLDLLTTDQRLIFVGEWYPGPDATPFFFKRLIENWTLIDEFPVYDWASMHAHGYVFEKTTD